ncbi:MAG: ATP-binding protein [Candidatus Eisenbacteria bacterium]|nr:ATP-binding protein [Candidatus Eisenbacteria bacterium]
MMKQLVVLSGKGGTGKTSVAAALAVLASRERKIVLADADVDAANLAILLDPIEEERVDFVSPETAAIDPERCVACGLCAEACRFDAIPVEDSVYRVDPLGCEGCRACLWVCPEDAIRMEREPAGFRLRSRTPYGLLHHAHLFPGAENSGKLVSEVRREARRSALDGGADFILIDGPPGIGCPVIAASTGVDLALLVAEPTVSAIHDLARVRGAAEHFDVPCAIVVNKWDLNPGKTAEIERFAARDGLEIWGRIPYDREVPRTLVMRRPITECPAEGVRKAIAEIWEAARRAMDDAGDPFPTRG